MLTCVNSTSRVFGHLDGTAAPGEGSTSGGAIRFTSKPNSRARR
jgi:hypothetical protein